ncbi:MAG: response regulator [Dehalococcoidia bacterium]
MWRGERSGAWLRWATGAAEGRRTDVAGDPDLLRLSIALQSGRGRSFRIVGARSGAQHRAEADSQLWSGASVACVLVVDDDPLILRLVSQLIEEAGHAVTTASDGRIALEQIEGGLRPDLIVLDMRMPVMDGWGFHAAMTERALDIPLFVMTAAQHPERSAGDVDAAGFISKPFDLDDLVAGVEACLAVPNDV